MRSPWKILGLTPGCSETDIKAAYARLVKQHRPDVDPEGFRRIHDAYRWLRSRHAADAEDPVDDEDEEHVADDEDDEDEEDVAHVAHVDSPPFAPARGEAPPSFVWEASVEPEPDEATPVPAPHPTARRRRALAFVRRVTARLDAARAAGDKLGELRTLRRFLRVWRAWPRRCDAWGALIRAEAERSLTTMLSMFPDADVVADLRDGGAPVVAYLLRACVQQDDWSGFRCLVGAVERHRDSARCTDAVAETLALGASLMALVDWRRARALVSAAFPLMSPSARARDLEELDRRVQAGREIESLSQHHRLVLARALASGGDGAPPDELRAAIKALGTLPATHAARAVLGECLPDVAALPPPRAGRAKAGAERKRRFMASGWFLVVVLSLVRGLMRCDATSTSGPTPARKQELLREAEARRALIEQARERLRREPLLPGSRPGGR